MSTRRRPAFRARVMQVNVRTAGLSAKQAIVADAVYGATLEESFRDNPFTPWRSSRSSAVPARKSSRMTADDLDIALAERNA